MHSNSFRQGTVPPYSFPPVIESETTRPPLSELSKALRERAEDSISQLRGARRGIQNVCYANSLGSESIVLTDLIWGSVPEIDIFSVDTRALVS